MDLKKLEYFEAVSRLGSFTKAAEELLIAQPSITTSIQRLEDELQIKLLVRDTRKVLLTAEGEIFLKKARNILELVARTEIEMGEMKTTGNMFLNVGLPPILAGNLMAELYNHFNEVYPEVTLKILEMGSIGICKAMENEEIELGFVVLRDDYSKKFKVMPQMHGEIHIAMSKENPLAQLDRIPIKMLKDQPIIQIPSHSFVRKQIDLELKMENIVPHVIAESSLMITVFNLIAHNVGVSFVLGDGMDVIDNIKNIVTRPFENPLNFTAGWIWNKNHALSYSAKKCVEFAKYKVFNQIKTRGCDKIAL